MRHVIGAELRLTIHTQDADGEAEVPHTIERQATATEMLLGGGLQGWSEGQIRGYKGMMDEAEAYCWEPHPEDPDEDGPTVAEPD